MVGHAIVQAIVPHNAALPGQVGPGNAKGRGIQRVILSHVPAITRCKQSAYR